MADGAAETSEVRLLGEDVEYTVKQSSDASEPRVDVDIHGVSVVVPTETDSSPEELLKENAAWVVEKQRKYESYRKAVPERQFEEGETFPYLGDEYELVVEQRSNHEISDGEIRLRESAVGQSTIENVLENVYRREARNEFTQRADEFASKMGVEYAKIEIRNQRTKWGSCSTNGILGVNWRLVMAPPGVVDYVIIHELAHLREQNHTDRFWELVAEQIPEYQKRIAWLEQNSVDLIYTTDDL